MVEAGQAGVRLDRVLAARPSIGSREKARQALRSGKVSVQGVRVGPEDAGQPLAEGATVTIAWARPGTSPRRAAGREKMARVGVSVLFEDGAILAVDKPAGLLTDAASREQVRTRDTLRKRVRQYLGREAWPVHRIDRDTTGAVLFAKTEAAREHLKAQWGRRTPVRSYLVVLEGRLQGEGRFADWMVWDGRAKVQRPGRGEGAVLAEADWRVVETFARASLVEVRLVSGRRNQIRLHAQLAGHPLVGETLYRETPATVRFPRQALHAARLEVLHPETDQPIVFEAPLPPDLGQLLRKLR